MDTLRNPPAGGRAETIAAYMINGQPLETLEPFTRRERAWIRHMTEYLARVDPEVIHDWTLDLPDPTDETGISEDARLLGPDGELLPVDE